MRESGGRERFSPFICSYLLLPVLTCCFRLEREIERNRLFLARDSICQSSVCDLRGDFLSLPVTAAVFRLLSCPATSHLSGYQDRSPSLPSDFGCEGPLVTKVCHSLKRVWRGIDLESQSHLSLLSMNVQSQGERSQGRERPHVLDGNNPLRQLCGFHLLVGL